MKKVAAISLLILLIAPMLSKLFLVTNYLYQYDYYVNVLCENKEKPELKCNGTCHLAQELKVVEEKESSPELPAQVKVEPPLFYQEVEEVLISVINEQITYPESSASHYISPFLKASLPPPRV
ncbi:hypothetical protein O3Q51_11845 [Cryomorphaceae bacterium 1068]|nr:hypothetical protein [Cryomorphaceae bacterium 1068]